MNKFVIYACFSRSFDNHHVENNQIHLISSIAGFMENSNTDIFNYLKFLENTDLSYEFGRRNNRYYIFYIAGNVISDIKSMYENVHYTKGCYKVTMGTLRNITVVYLTMEQLLGHLTFTKMDNELIDNIFGNKKLTEKNLNSLYTNSLFVFSQMSWSEIVKQFLLSNIKISGGNVSKRHILSSVDIQLSNFLNEIYRYKIPLDNKHSVDKSKLLSNTMSNEEYKIITGPKDELSKLSLNKLNTILETNDDDKNENKTKISFLKTNLLYSFDVLRDAIINHYESKNKNIKETITRLMSDLKFDISELERIEKLYYNIRKMGMSSKEKKRFKEGRRLLLKNPRSHYKIDSLKSNIQFNKKKINDLNNNLTKLDNELAKFKNKFDTMSIYNLNKIYETLTKGENKSFKFSKIRTYNNTNNYSNFIRYYSTNSYNRNDNKLSSYNSLLEPKSELKTNLIDESEKNMSNINKLLNDNKNISKNNLFINYFDEIIQNPNLSPIEKQTNIENKWVDHLLDKLDTIDNKARNSLSYIIKKANETLNLIVESKRIKKRFPDFHQKLNKNHLIIAYCIMTTFYDKLGFTAIAFKIGNDILYDIYSKEWIEFNKNELYIGFNDFILNKNINNVVKLKLGSFFIEIFCQKPTYIFDRTYKSDKLYENSIDSDLAILEINEEFFNFIQNNFILSPVSLPMLCKPNIWSEKEFGGYLENTNSKDNIITGSTNQKHIMDNKNSLYKAINKLNSTKFKINTDLLNYLENEGFNILEHYFNKKLKDKTDRNQNRITLMISKSLSKYNHPFYICTNAD